jgi:hypothetical protein
VNITVSSGSTLQAWVESKRYVCTIDCFSMAGVPTAQTPWMQAGSSISSSEAAFARSYILHHIGFSSRRWNSMRSARTTETGSACKRSAAAVACRVINPGDSAFGILGMEGVAEVAGAIPALLAVILSQLVRCAVDLQSSSL